MINEGLEPRIMHLGVQVDQSLYRMPTLIGIVPCVAPKGKYFYAFRDKSKQSPKLLSAKEVFRLQDVVLKSWAGWEFTHT